VTSDDGKSFNVTVAAGGTATFTAPTKPGTYPFHCSVHPQMHGTLVVKP
jgi:plastocyanin